MLKRAILLYSFLCCVAVIHLAAQQRAEVEKCELCDGIERQLAAGNKQALRDIATLLDDPRYGKKAAGLLAHYTLFTPREFNFHEGLSRLAFLDFYYENENAIQFSTLLQAYFITPVEQRNASYDLEKVTVKTTKADSIPDLRLQNLIRQAWMHPFSKSIIELKEAWWAAGHIHDSIALRTCILYCELATLLRDSRDVGRILDWVENDILPPALALPYLAKITGYNFSIATSKDKFIAAYQNILTDSSDLNALLHERYDSVFAFHQNFFFDSVDYYGKALATAVNTPFLQHNIILDLIHIRHPRALFYIASQVYRYRGSNSTALWPPARYDQLLQQLTHVNLLVQHSSGMTLKNEDTWKDRPALQNYLFYWANRYSDYEWDESYGHFVNLRELEDDRLKYERYFRRLTNSDFAVARDAYERLMYGPPEIILPLHEKYKSLRVHIHPQLPPLHQQYLPVIVQLIRYCKKQHIETKASGKLGRLLQQLENIPDERSRYLVENQIIAQLNPDNITAFEIWAFLHTADVDHALSAGRIVKRFYTAYLPQIVNHDLWLRQYLKKSVLFKKLKVSGVSNTYSEMLYNHPKVLFKEGEFVETDADILTAYKDWYLRHLFKTDFRKALRKFWESAEAPVASLPPPPDSIAIVLLYDLDNVEPARYNQFLKEYLSAVKTDALLPGIFELLESGRATHWTIDFLKDYFVVPTGGISDRPDFWLDRWNAADQKIKGLYEYFYKLLKERLKETAVADIADIIWLVNSPVYREADKPQLLEALQKVQNIDGLWKLKFRPRLVYHSDIQYFDTLYLEPRHLDDIPLLFQESERTLLIPFLLRRLQQFSLEERGVFINEMFRHIWFMEWLEAHPLPHPRTVQIKTILETYFAMSEYLTEVEERDIQVHLALLQLAGKSLEEKIHQSAALGTGRAVRAEVQRAILAKVHYEDLKLIFNNWAYIRIGSNRENTRFLRRDFGLPIYGLKDSAWRTRVLVFYTISTEKQFYRIMLERFGLDFQTNDGQLDFQKIIDILKYDLAYPFAGNGGERKGFYHYGIIKYLELYFNTRLGFHEKLNEYQTFFQFTSAERATAWISFLQKNVLAGLRTGGR